MHVLATIASVVVLLATPALAQSGNPAGMTPGTGPQQPNNSDRVFVHAAAIGGMAEVELGNLAQQKAQSEAVKDFGRRMVEDHGKANEQLKSIAEEKGITLPDNLDQDQQHTIDELSQLSGEEFDSAYMDQMVKDHENDVVAFREQVESGKDPGLRAFAEETLPILEEHLNLAQQIDQELTVAPGDGRLDLAERHRNLLLRD
jgi:putative membrane protein